jgi:hypothetical protein
MTEPSGNVLIVYGLYQWPLRSTVEDHLYAFRRHSDRRCFYFNALADRVTPHLLGRRYDMIVFHTTFLSSRWSPEVFAKAREAARPLKELEGTRIALPQDEYLHTDLLTDFYEEFGVEIVASVGAASQWPKLYDRIDPSGTRFHRVLTGYLEEDTLERIDAIVAETPQRDIDIGYRAWQGAYWLGRHGTLKGRIATAFREPAEQRGLAVDISTRDEDTLWRDDWFRFLARCRYTIGIEGGASMHDPRGEVRDRVDAYVAAHPDATFDEVEAACFPGEDGVLDYVALSPRHLEACATRTCQILIEGSYNDILRPWEHYVPVKADLSDLEVALDVVADERRREEIVERAYRDVVASGAWTYRSFVREVEELVLGTAAGAATPRRADDARALAVNRVRDRLAWARVAYALSVRPKIDARAQRVPGLGAGVPRLSARALIDRLRWSRPAAIVASAVPAEIKTRLRAVMSRRSG